MRQILRSVAFVTCVAGLGLATVAGAADPSLVGWWRFDEGAGTIARDASGNGNHGTLVGAEWHEGGWNGTGRCLEFIYGQGDRVAIENNMDVIGAGITITAWMNPYSFRQHDCRVVSKSSTAATADGHWWMLGSNNSVNVRFRLKTNESATTLTLIDTAGVLVTNEWQFITAMWDGAVATTYVDTVETGRATKGGTAVAVDSSVPVAIGNQPASAGDGERAFDGLIDEVRIYNRALTAEELAEVMQGGGPGSFTELASGPVPSDGAVDVPRDTALSWTAGAFAAAHDVYLGTSFDDVNTASRANPLGVLVSQGQADAAYDPAGLLDLGQTYYWRVDEVNAAPDSTIFKGAVWSFTSEPVAYPITNVTATAAGTYSAGSEPANTVNGSGLNANDQHSIDLEDMWLGVPNPDEPLWIQFEFDRAYKLHELWVWNYNIAFEATVGFGIKDATLEYSIDGQTWASLGDVTLARGAATASYTHNTTIDLGGAMARFVRLTVNSGYGFLGQYWLSEVRFFYIPVQAREPQPASGATNVPVETILDWRGGREAASHEVFLGTDPQTLVLVDAVAETQYNPGTLDLGTTYYWKVDEVNEAADPARWEGEVWSFSTLEYFVVEDFESYTNDIDAGKAIFQTWIDGYEDESNGSQVGYLDAPFAERSTVHGGTQSMPLFFDNTSAATSVADLKLDGQDWTQAGIQTLVLFFRGDAENTGGQFYAEINGAKVVYPGAANVLTRPVWKQWNIELASVGANLRNVTRLSVGVDGGGSGLVYVDDIRLYRSAPPLPTPEDPGMTGLLAWYAFDNGATDSSGNGYNGTLLGDAQALNGQLVLDGVDDAVTVPRIGGASATFSTFSYAMWVNPSTSVTSIAYSGGLNSDGWSAGGVHFKFHNGVLNVGINGLGTGDLDGKTIVPVNAWTHIALTVSPTEIVIYMNGQQEDYRAINAPLTNLTLGGTLGAWSNSGTIEREMPGKMDDVRIYNRALSPGEVLYLAEL